MKSWEASLRKYTSTSWVDGGPGESALVSEIRLMLAEVERFRAILDEVPMTDRLHAEQEYERKQREAAEAKGGDDG